MAEAVVTFVLEQLGEFLVDSIVQEANFLFGVDKRINAAKAELRHMRCFLKDADARARGGDERVLNWVAEIREATYDLEDAIIIYASQVIPRRKNGVKNVLKRLVCLYGEGVELHRIGSKIEGITTSLSSLRDSLMKYGVQELSASGEGAASSSNNRVRELRREYSHVFEPDVVGTNEDIKKLVALLVKDGNVSTPRVVSICGMGGLGKTTLARKVYQHSGIRDHFDRLAWASISQQCNVSGVWKEIFLKLCPEEKENIRDSEICGKLYRVMKERKCLIVLDDIWTPKIWDCLSHAFPRDETCSKILITTRNKDLVFHADVNGLNHEPRCLNEDDSWELFEKIYRNSQTNLEDFEEKKKLGKELLKLCGGLPLAIIVLRGVMSQKKTVFEWEAVRKYAKMYINDGKVTELRDSKHLGVSWVLGLSYDELPYQLKPCFLHLANFPEDHKIRVNELCQMWMAEGLVASEDRAYEYLKELEQRSIVQIATVSAFNGRIKTCRIHDLIRDLCLLKSQEENFIHSITITDGDVKAGSLVSDKIRRISVISSPTNVFTEDQMVFIIRDHDSLRSFMFVGVISLTMITLKSWFKCFHMLRVLIFNRSTETYYIPIKIPEEVGKLVHLRFLSFKGCYLNGSLPPSVCKLRRLQILDLRVSGGDPLEVANWRLEQLIHLYLTNYFPLRDHKLYFENFRSLRTLVGVSNSYPGFSKLAQMTNLTKMEVIVETDLNICVTFNNLHSLTIIIHRSQAENIVPIISRCPKIRKLKVVGSIEKLPEPSQISVELVKLTMEETRYHSDVLMPTLEKLPKLKILRLVKAFETEEAVCCSKDGFPRLESLYISFLKLKEWRMEKGAFPLLRDLTLKKCNGVDRIVQHFEGNPTLKVSVFE